jgi:hypothetical protein
MDGANWCFTVLSAEQLPPAPIHARAILPEPWTAINVFRQNDCRGFALLCR